MYLLLGDPVDALMLLGFVFVVMTITIVQARRTEHALEALRDLSSPRAVVIRDGQRRRIAGREVVAGDLVVLAEGDRVPADGLLRQALHLATDESLLTGESVPVRKAPSPDAGTLDRPGGDDLPPVFSGTLVTSGQGIVETAATGPRTELGKIGRALEQTEEEPTMLQTETRRIVRILAITGLGACCVVRLRPSPRINALSITAASPRKLPGLGGLPGPAAGTRIANEAWHDSPAPLRKARTRDRWRRSHGRASGTGERRHRRRQSGILTRR